MNKKDIELLKQNDEVTFEKYYYKYHKLYFTIIYKMVNDFYVTENLVQETFVKVIEDINSYRGGSFKYWTITISKNIANMYLRKTINERKAYQDLAEEESIKENKVTEDVDLNNLLSKIKEIVNEETYQIIIMRLVKGLKFKDIAKLKDTTTSSVLGKYHRGLKTIRSRIDNEKD